MNVSRCRVLGYVVLGVLTALMDATTTAQAGATPSLQRPQFFAQGDVAGCINRPAGSETMSVAAIKALIEQARELWTSGNADGFAALFTPDGEFIVPGKRWTGPGAIRKVAADYAAAYSNVKIDIHRILVDGNQAVVEWSWQDTENATGRRSQADDAIVVDFQDGQISRWREYIDTQTPTSQAQPD